ncbi:hypothetical protein MASR2M66_30950 [Chloroflexota bacterium]
MKQKRGFPTLVAFALTLLACAVPGLPFGSAPAPTAITTPDTRLEVMVAETVSAAITMTQAALPTATKAAPTPRPTATAAATATLSAESMLDYNSDGTKTFIDLPGKYQLTVPMQWLAVRINSPEYDAALGSPEAANPSIQHSLSLIKEQDSNVFRLFMLDTNEEHMSDGFVSNINLVWDSQMEASFENDSDLKSLVEALPASLKNSEVLGSSLQSTANNTPYGIITIKTPTTAQDGTDVVIFQKLVFFDLPTGTLTMTLSTTETWQATVEPSFDETLNSFIVLQ